MHINELHLLSANLDLQEVFYRDTLGLSVERKTTQLLEVICGENRILFHERLASPYYYHFAFLIPTGSLEAAITYAKQIGLELLENQGEIITHFDNGRAIYFHDADENIAEFIERPLVDYPHQEHFNIEDLIKINEIGLPSPKPLQVAQNICAQYGIRPLAPKRFDDAFCWVGNHEGTIIVVKEGRGWLPTGRACISAPFLIYYTEGDETHCYSHDWPES